MWGGYQIFLRCGGELVIKKWKQAGCARPFYFLVYWKFIFPFIWSTRVFFPNIDFCVYICLHLLLSSTSVCAINENCVRLTAFPLIKKNTNKRESGINVFYFYFYFVVKATTDDKTAHLITGYPTPLGGYVHCGTFPLWEMMTWMLTVVRITRHHPEGNCKTRSSPLGGSFFHIFVDPDSNHSYIHTFREGNAMSAPPKNIRRMRIPFIFSSLRKSSRHARLIDSIQVKDFKQLGWFYLELVILVYSRFWKEDKKSRKPINICVGSSLFIYVNAVTAVVPASRHRHDQ